MSNKSHFFRQSSGGGGEPFIATFRTTTLNESITLPYLSNGVYSGTIDWGDGTVVANTYANRTHSYVNSGDYDITVLGECVGFSSVNNLKIINIKQWGNGFRLIDNVNGSYFYGNQNLDITATDTLNLEGITGFKFFFYTNTNLVFNDSINNWNTSSAQTMDNVFRLDKLFNQPLNNWDVSNVTTMVNMFFDAEDFNQPLNNWNTSNVTTMNNMFAYADDFNQDISSWNFSGLNLSNALQNFIRGGVYDANYYDNLLIKWASDPSLGGLQPNIIGTIDVRHKYTANGASARASILANNKAVTINDGGQI